jgi:5'-methylthioadenosine phosphorylase
MKIGIIGGSGLDDPRLLESCEEVEVDTPYGKPSSSITCGRISNVEICILSRHGKKHEISPSNINYRANIYALKKLGCKYILASSAVGSLREEIKPGDLIFPDQVIDFTKTRKTTFFDKIGEVEHKGMAEPFSNFLRKIMREEANKLGFKNHDKATILTVEGPRFSTKAESFMFRKLGADLIGMTTSTESFLAKEAGLEYAVAAMSTDYDCWKEGEEPVSWEMIKKRMEENADKVKKLFLKVIENLGRQEIREEDIEFIKSKIRTVPDFPKPGIMFRDITTLLKEPEAVKKVLEILYEKYEGRSIEVVAAIESRGFIFGSLLADKLNAIFVPVRKPGKLPAETLKEEYELEYGKDAVEIHRDALQPGQKVLVCDDLLATGGTALATCNLVERLGGEVEECCFVIELTDLKGREKLNKWNVFSLIKFEGE